MLTSDWTALLARELLAELHRQAEHQRLARLAQAQRGGKRRRTRRLGWRGRAGLVRARRASRQRLPWPDSAPLGQGGERA
jgi:hypothetical protein